MGEKYSAKRVENLVHFLRGFYDIMQFTIIVRQNMYV